MITTVTVCESVSVGKSMFIAHTCMNVSLFSTV